MRDSERWEKLQYKYKRGGFKVDFCNGQTKRYIQTNFSQKETNTNSRLDEKKITSAASVASGEIWTNSEIRRESICKQKTAN